MNHSLEPWNIFGIGRSTRTIARTETEQQLLGAWQTVVAVGESTLILGEGSNVLSLSDYASTVILSRVMEIEVSETSEAQCLHIGTDKNWCQLVQLTLQYVVSGLENSVLIPSCVGPPPIQNIGAYGVELQRVCNYMDCIELETGRKQCFSAAECRFDYRDSTFKYEYQDRYAIVVIGLTLAKAWQPIPSCGDLTRLDPRTVTPQQVSDSVCYT